MTSNVIVMDEVAREMQDNLKRMLINQIMDKDVVLTSVDFNDIDVADAGPRTIVIKYLVGKVVEKSDGDV